MNFQGALIRGLCTDLTIETAPCTVLFRDMVFEKRPLSEIARNAQKYVRCSFIGENIEDFEDIFDIYRAVDATQVVFSDIHAKENWVGAMPPVDVAFRLQLPVKHKSFTAVDVKRWEAKRGVKLSDALDIHWISLDPDFHFSLDEYTAKVLIPESHKII